MPDDRTDADDATDDTSPVDRRRLDDVFGDVLPETTSDERDQAPAGNDEWLRANRPPHH